MPEMELHILRESVDLLILKALTQGPKHGYAIAEWIESATQATVLLEEGTLYPALHRLESRRLVRSKWGVSDSKRAARFYALTPSGQEHLARHASTWQRHVQGIAAALALSSNRGA